MNSKPSNGSTKLVRVRDAGVMRGPRWIFRHVEMELLRGKFVCLIGANGAGKTTCAKAVLGLIEISEGSIERAPSLEVGYVPQKLPFSPSLPLTVRRLMTLTGRFDDNVIDEALKSVGLDRLGDPPVTTLSGGELQRLLLARALAHRPDLLVLDEPDQGIDIAGADRLYNLIEQIRNDLGCGILLISHDLQRAMDVGDDVCVLVPYEHDIPTEDKARIPNSSSARTSASTP